MATQFEKQRQEIRNFVIPYIDPVKPIITADKVFIFLAGDQNKFALRIVLFQATDSRGVHQEIPQRCRGVDHHRIGRQRLKVLRFFSGGKSRIKR